MSRGASLLVWLVFAMPVDADQKALSADEIMARVAANQDRSVKLRREFIYQQRVRIVTRRTNGKPAREETADYRVVPSPETCKKQLQRIDGRYWHEGKYVEFHGEPLPDSDSMDGDLIHDFREDLTNDLSKDGLGRNLFPLTSEEQKKYRFELLGEESLREKKVYRVKFGPREKGEWSWAGEALIDAEEFQPVQVFTRLPRRIPIMVRTVLGTDLPGLGFNVEYRRFGDGVWFPLSFGTEFHLRAVFFIRRDITMSVENSAFERAHVESKILSHELAQ